MHSFWTLFKADFLAETLSMVLFSGKHPRFIAFIFLLFIGIYYVIRTCLRICIFVICIPFRTKHARIRRSLNTTTRVARKLGDSCSKVSSYENSLQIQISGENWSNQINSLLYRVHKNTGLLQVFIYRNHDSLQLDYAFLVHHAGLPYGSELTHESLPLIHHKIRTNLL